MRALLRQAALLVVSALLSWWVLLRVPSSPTTPRTLPVRTPVIELTPLASIAPKPEAPTPPAELVERAPEPAPAPAPAPAEARNDEASDKTAEVAEGPASASPPSPPEERLSLPAPRAQLPPPSAPAADPHAEPLLALHAQAPSAPAAEHVDEPRSEPLLPDPPARTSAPEDAAPAAPLARAEPDLPELGDPRGKAEAPASEPAPGAPAPASDDAPLADAPIHQAPAPHSVAALMSDPGLVAQARDEFERGQPKGFATVLLATPEDQLEIARFFGEELVLVPRRALDPSHPEAGYFHLTPTGAPRVEAVPSPPVLERYRQYRDLFDYEYGRLPLPLRELRRSVLARGEIYLFAALLSPEEWALIIARRREALELSRRELSDVRRFVLRYRRSTAGEFDLGVEEIVFADGTRFRPGARGAGG